MATAAQRPAKDVFQRQIAFGSRPQHQENDLHHAADSGDLWRMTSLLFRNPEYKEQKDADGCTPLLRSALHHDYRTARVLVQHGANLHARDRDGQTVLHYAALGAAATGDLNTLHYLMGFPELDPMDTDNDGVTPKQAVLNLPPEEGFETQRVAQYLSIMGG